MHYCNQPAKCPAEGHPQTNSSTTQLLKACSEFNVCYRHLGFAMPPSLEPCQPWHNLQLS
jgi:hypothetical protein